MAALGYVGRVPQCGYIHEVRHSTLIAGHYKLEAIGNHAAFVVAAMNVQINGVCFFNATEASVLQAVLGRQAVRG